jgi:hypothetical protein
MAVTTKANPVVLFVFTTDENSVQLPVSTTNPIPVTPVGGGTIGAPSTSVTTVQGVAFDVAFSFTRTADTNAYAAGDVIGINAAGSPGSAIHTIPLIGPSGGTIIITGAELRVDLAAVTAGMTGFRLHLFDAAPTAILDNAAFDLDATSRGKYLGFIDFGVVADFGSTLWAQADGLSKQVKLAAASTSLYAELQTLGAYTPTSAESFSFKLHALAA